MTSIAGIDSPYKGLVPYSEEDAQFFFGREAEREIIEANLMASRLTLLYGPSGVGKSSALRAGVIHHLRAITTQHLRAQRPVKFIVVIFNSWRDDPIKGLTDCVHDAIVKTFKDRSIEMPAPQSSITETLLAWTKMFDLLIILDQFEEYFLYHPLEEGNPFDTEFPRAVNHPGLRTNFLVSIREDELAKLDRFKGQIPNLFENYLRLEHLNFDAARDAIKKPIEQYNLLYPADVAISVEPALVDIVLAQVKTGEVIIGEGGRGATKSSVKAQIEAPYLQLVMTRLWDEELNQNSRTLRFETLERLGGAKSIVSTHLDRVMRTLRKKDQATAAVFFQYLVTPSGTKIAYPVADLVEYSKRSEEEVKHILTTLQDERVLRHIPPSLDQPSTVRYEIYHDVLAPAILDWRSRFLQRQRTERVFRPLGLFLIILMLVGGIWYSQQPKIMTGNFNIAIAQFGEIQEDGSIKPSDLADLMGDTLFNFWQSEYQSVVPGLNIQVAHKNIPLIHSDAQAMDLARKINADIMIYGSIYYQGSQSATLSPRFYVVGRTETLELTGQNGLASPIAFNSSNLGALDRVNRELLARSELLLSFTEAINYKSQGNLDAALRAIQRSILAVEKLSHPFAGMEAIYLLASQIQSGRKNYDAASQLIDHALAINPIYAKAYLASGDIYYSKASAANFDPAMLDAALTYYERANEIPNQPVGAYIPFKAHLGIANVIVIKAQQTDDPALLQKAVEYYTDVTKEYERTQDPILRSDAAIAYLGLGTIYKKLGKLEQALQEYQNAYNLADDQEFKANIQQSIQQIQK